MPIIARELLGRADARDIRLKGIATGDGCLGIDVLCGGPNLALGAPWWDVVFFYGHGQVSNAFYDELLTVCTVEQLKQPVQPPRCAAMVQKMYTVVGGFYGKAVGANSHFVTVRRRRVQLVRLLSRQPVSTPAPALQH